MKLIGSPEQWAIFSWLLIALAQSGLAEETDPLLQKPSGSPELRLEDLTKLEIPTVEGASKYSQKSTEAPASVSIITSDDVKKYGYRTLAEILQSVRGLQVSYNRNYSFLGVRGFNRGDYNSRVLVLIDGHRINNSLSDGAFIGTEFILDVDLIDRVEVIRGPGASLYGNNAFFGVVNVITRKGRDLSGYGAELSGEVGSFDTYKGRATYGQRFENGLDLLLSGSWYDSQGPENLFFKEFNQPANNNGIAHKADDDAYRSAFGSISFFDFTLEGAYNTREKGIPTTLFGTKFNDSRTRSTDERSFVSLKFAHEFPESVDLSAQVYYDQQNFQGEFFYPPLLQQIEEAQWWGLELQAKKVFLERHVLIAGAEYRDDFIQSLRFSPPSAGVPKERTTYNYGVFLQGDAAVLTNLHVNAGFRYDVYGHTEPAVNPRLALIYDPWDKATLKAIRGHAFRAPNFFERVFNPDLIPEKILSHELVYEQGIGNNLRSSVSGFYNEIEHLINFNPQANPVYQNVKGAKARGVESDVQDFFGPLLIKNPAATAAGAELELQGFWSSGWRGRISYTLQDTEFHQPGVFRSDSPKHLGKVNVIAPLLRDKIFAGVEFQYTSTRLTLQGTETSGFGVVNLTLFSQNLLKGLELSGSIYNLLDRHYSDPATPFLVEEVIPRDGRTFRVKLTYRF